MDAPTIDARRSSIEKTPIAPPPFHRLPDEIIEQILTATDPNGFASLVLLNRKWRAVSQRSYLYRHHLARCPSYSASHTTLPSVDDDNLPRLRRLFAHEVKRNLFEAYRRPSETVIKLVSNSISSSSCPGGEGMQFSTSPRGHHILAYNSSRIYVIDVRSPTLEVKRELKILRRPISACIKDDGTVLVILSTEMQVDLYDLQKSPPRRTQSIILDNTPRTIALSPCGSVLAAAYEGGIEVSSMKPDSLPTDRRAVKCDAVDTLAFSFDGTQILGTTTQSSSPATVILTAPYYDPGSHLPDDNISPLWTTSILFPNTSRDCSHAVLLQDGHEEEAGWTFTYDRSFETFRAVRIDDLRNGTTYFTGPAPSANSQAKLLPCTLPAATYRGELVSAGFQGKEIWIYGVPEDLDAVPDTATSSTDGSSASSGLGRENSGRSGTSRRPSTRAQDTHGGRVPQWQLLCDKLRNTFVAGCKVSELAGLSHVKWVNGFGASSAQERLVVAARGITPDRLVTDEEDIDFIDGGRLTLLDFDYGSSDGTKTEITIEVGTDNAEVLEEEQRDMETEVAIVRRRTVAQRRGGRTALLRAATTASRAPAVPDVPAVPPLPQSGDTDDDPLIPRRIGQIPPSRPGNTEQVAEDDEADGISIDEMEALDAPYAHASPRSGTTLRRAATAAAVNRTLHPVTADGRRIEYRRADGRPEHPHESDADNWVPPPPPYQKEQDPQDLPAFMRGTPIAPPISVIPPVPPMPPAFATSSQHRPPTDDTKGQRSISETPSRPPVETTASDSNTMSRPRTSETSRPDSSPSERVDNGDNQDLYDVTPPDSPEQRARQSTESAHFEGRNRRVSALSVAPSELQRPLTAPLNPAAMIPPPSGRSDPMGEFNERPQTTTLGLQIPPSNGGTAQPSSAPAPRMRSLSNAQTWPAGLRPGADRSAGVADGFPFSAPATQITADEMASTLPPLPSTSQLASLNKRVSQGNPRRLSGGFQVQRRPVGSSDGQGSSSRHQLNPYSEPEFDQPLIISTPKGVSGAFDSPSRQISGRRNETPLLAPIPRHPRPTHNSTTRPTVERLETIYSVASSHGGNQAPTMPLPVQQQSGMLPAWLHAPPVPTTRTSPGVNRRPSRAERSAAKNIQDAKKRGWNAKNKKKKKKKHADAASSAGWTDVSVNSTNNNKSEKDKKCIVM
ncbi:Fc.00g062650.m01.CDS01 [Cosmosporella sp. VM-42]